ncbi:50S ribosomal protein L21 [Candidatus Uhrbacteria bacterium CG_4_9_14_0_2_um_filter_41_50]|uniref:Large ribosomal subunit protein bL21 n=1 Tax=Candidatus Uhrbacteria bacterium CG_4_9_14_0_2_um_filter_41_50 TaxID=1975031 RepID=A0A2M8EMZ2_9BACT|nr:MAG: 50S ribosomal protein L21 [Candidatus Uhrbacteria bacterium CG_4_10_14_3_um_filter_41_21]PIZ54699.1 MAG: 50S ribosomal protein L21 [Candidatus Uhrbacteria bacterium CG_4_10_14_0_2_um_filter_41_21]PJB84720.1 MAG: 50S ribosomal protein L21 [Candidatus Uhrbacteria bacterium CG_4_9_14_0_8_um_filter_41_16]PJC24098.1 MAG: 50S ribosomal protein L21 [Candidatus Uhrbacteria bacterium CG_4_9_14_0_2_um_filter_41_50]PJE74790.1 MAG: 50S ribosomal protein L21 [Candidatus Uhrbacteria bacterium CG10_bi
MFAVIKTGGKQYVVREGQELKVEKLELLDGEKIEFDALLVSDDEGTDTKIGTPFVDGAKVTVSVMETGKGKKIHIVKYKPKSRYRRNNGHRQPYTKLKIEKIG